MPCPWRIFLPLALVLCTVSLAAVSRESAEDMDQNRRDLAALHQQDPEEHARLRQQVHAFLALPTARREQLVKLDADLHQLPSARQARLLDVLKRYADWLETLPERDREAIQDAPSREARLQRIRRLRQRQWLQSLPRADRARLEKLQGQALTDEVARLREEERQRRRDWQVAARFWEPLLHRRQPTGKPMPTQLSDLDGGDKTFVLEYLRPLLTPAEWEQLDRAQGQWPRFPRLLVELAQRHPVALPGPRGPTHLDELPKDVRKLLQKAAPGKPGYLRHALKREEGKWPGFAVAVTRLAGKHSASLPLELWPARSKELSGETRKFLQTKLEPALSDDEKQEIKKAEGSWPAYALTIQRLAASHYLSVPWQTLPGPRGRWDWYRPPRPAVVEGLPPLPHQTLRDFARTQLSDAERAALRLSDTDPADWERLTRLYFDRRPGELRRLRQLDQRRRPH
jgi:hypothetical protein